MLEDTRIGGDLGGIAPVIVPLVAAHFGGSLLDGVVAIALPAAGEFAIAPVLLPEMLGGDLSARDLRRRRRCRLRHRARAACVDRRLVTGCQKDHPARRQQSILSIEN
jgi:hypothetical protein